MPIYEYRCCSCGQEFEELVLGAEESPKCPECGGEDAERLLSGFAVGEAEGAFAGLSAPAGGCGGSGGFT